MSGEEDQVTAAFEAGDRKHVSACLDQGGFARIVHLGPKRIALVGPDGGPWRFRPHGVAKDAWWVGLPVVEPIATKVLYVEGRRMIPARLATLQLLAEGCRDRWSRREIAHVIGCAITALPFIIDHLVEAGLVAKTSIREGSATRAYYSATAAGRELVRNARRDVAAGVAAPAVPNYLTRALAQVAGGVTVDDLVLCLDMTPASARTIVSRLLALGLIERDPTTARGFQRTRKGEKVILEAVAA